jgi:predicted nucleic acid-binding protein
VPVVIADTSPLRYLIQIELIEILPKLFDAISIPSEVARELSNKACPAAVRSWIAAPPEWLRLQDGERSDEAQLQTLDAGERAAIELSIALRADLLLIDDRKGAKAAARMGFVTIGTLGILDLAAKRKFIDLRKAFDDLSRTNFRYRRALLADLLVGYE